MATRVNNVEIEEQVVNNANNSPFAGFKRKEDTGDSSEQKIQRMLAANIAYRVKNLSMESIGAYFTNNYHPDFGKTVSEINTYINISLPSDITIDAQVNDGTGTFVPGEASLISCSLANFFRAVRKNKRIWASFKGSFISFPSERPKGYELWSTEEKDKYLAKWIGNKLHELFCGGEIDVLVQYVAAGELLESPYSDKRGEARATDRIIHYPERVTLGENGEDIMLRKKSDF